MLVKIKNKYVQVLKNYSIADTIQFTLTYQTEPNECYLMIDDNLDYCLSYGEDETYPLIGISKKQITQKLKQLLYNENH